VAIFPDGKTLRKPWPRGMDQWPQHLHGADNNAVSDDVLAGPPRHLQWVDTPTWSRSHMGIATVHAVVSSGGRLFSIEDRATPEHPFLPGRFKLIARDAFNGIELWRREIDVWEPVTRYVKSTAIELQRRLIAVDDTVFFTPSLMAPVKAIDARTGDVLRSYQGTEPAREMVYDRGLLLVVVGDRSDGAVYDRFKPEPWRGTALGGLDPKAPFGGAGFRGKYAPETADKPRPACRIRAIDADSGEMLWQTTPEQTAGYVPASIAARGEVAVFATRDALVCLDRLSGEQRWRTDHSLAGHAAGGTTEEAPIGVAPPTLVLADEALFVAQGSEVGAFSLDDGSAMWKGKAGRNYQRGPDLFVVGDAVWTGAVEAYAADNGEPLAQIEQRMTGPMGHDRCYRNFITKRFFINSKTGGADFLELATGREFPNHWTRGTCGMPVVPCNGMLYTGPFACQCSIGAMVPGMNAYRSAKGLRRSDQDVPVERKAILEKGPAYGPTESAAEASRTSAWPTYRHGAARGGATEATIPAELAVLWKQRLSSGPGAPTVAAGKVFVPEVNAHTLRAFAVGDGAEVWSFTAGARIDSPPTFWKGRLLFGCRDGWVYCLRAEDGKLMWRFKDLPDRLIGTRGQLESAWPVSGSILVVDDTAYFAAGRSSFLDGGIFLFGLNPRSGELVHSRRLFGPFQKKTGFPAVGNQGSRADVLVSDGEHIYMRHKAFNLDLTDAADAAPHVLPSAGFLEEAVHHRSYWTVQARFRGTTRVGHAEGDILVTDGQTSYAVEGFPVHRHSYFDPRLSGYRLTAVSLDGSAGGPHESGKREKRSRRRGGRKDPARPLWKSDVPIAGKAMALAGETIVIGGHRAHFPPEHPVEKYEAAYAGRLGGVLWLASTADGRKLAEYALEAVPAWDGIAVAGDKVFVSLSDGGLVCLAAAE
jgi:outer membrane protein assembly factor BamB